MDAARSSIQIASSKEGWPKKEWGRFIHEEPGCREDGRAPDDDEFLGRKNSFKKSLQIIGQANDDFWLTDCDGYAVTGDTDGSIAINNARNNGDGDFINSAGGDGGYENCANNLAQGTCKAAHSTDVVLPVRPAMHDVYPPTHQCPGGFYVCEGTNNNIGATGNGEDSTVGR